MRDAVATFVVGSAVYVVLTVVAMRKGRRTRE
jgi:hypothetical protein